MLSQDAGIGSHGPEAETVEPSADQITVLPAQRRAPDTETIASDPPPDVETVAEIVVETATDPDRHDPWPSARRQISVAVRLLCGLIAAVLLGHRFIPDYRGIGSLVDTFLPWTFVPLALALPASLVSRSRWAIGAAVLAAGVWGASFGPTLASRGSSGPADLRVLSQDLSSQDPDLAATARLAAARGADVVVLQGMNTAGIQASERVVPVVYRYHLALYEFSVWSKYEIVGIQPVGLAAAAGTGAGTVGTGDSGLFGGLLRFTVRLAPGRDVTVFAVHLPQPALSHSGFAVQRGEALSSLIAVVKADASPKLIVVGDLDLAQTDRGMDDLLGGGTGLVSAQAKAGSGFGFTWPSDFPMIRLDDVLVRGLAPVRSTVLAATGAHEGHRPIEADLRF